jgi:hypothetical protein
VEGATPPSTVRGFACVEADMKDARGSFNNSDKFPFCDDAIIPLSYSVHLDRLQFSLQSHYSEVVLDRLKTLFGPFQPIKEGKKFIYQFKHDHGLIDFVKWYEGCFYWGIIVHDPDAEVQAQMSMLMHAFHLYLSQVEVALDFHPEDRHDLNALCDVLSDGLVVKHSRAGCYREIHGTIYIGKDGNVRNGSKGARVYKKPIDGPHTFLRMELQFNRRHIKQIKISLPINPAV